MPSKAIDDDKAIRGELAQQLLITNSDYLNKNHC